MTCKRRQHQHPTWTYIHGDGKNNIDTSVLTGNFKMSIFTTVLYHCIKVGCTFGKGSCNNVSLPINKESLNNFNNSFEHSNYLQTSNVVVFFSFKCPILQKPCQLASFSNEHFVSRCTLRHRIWRYMPILTSIKQP